MFKFAVLCVVLGATVITAAPSITEVSLNDAKSRSDPSYIDKYVLRRQRRQLQQQLVRNGGYAPYRPPDNVPDDEDAGQQHLLPVSYIEQEGQQPIPVYDASYTTYRDQQLQMQQSQNTPVTRYAERSRPVSGNYIVGPADGRTPDLSRDTLVNDLLERQNARAGLIMVDPDAELTEIRDGKVVHAYAPNANARANKRHVRPHARVIRSTKGSIQRF